MHTTITPSVLYFGTPVALISTVNPDGSTNLSPISSLWALGTTYALGLGTEGHAISNIRRVPELVINLAEAAMVPAIERIAPTTGSDPVPPNKRTLYRHEPDKWVVGGLSPVLSDTVAPQRVGESPVQMEAIAVDVSPVDVDAVIVQARITRVHVRDDLVQPGTSYLDLDRWRPLYYTFRHYYTQGEDVGTNFKAEQ